MSEYASRKGEGWERQLFSATAAVNRALSKADEHGTFTFGNHLDIRTAAAKLRAAADRIEEIDRTFEVPESRRES